MPYTEDERRQLLQVARESIRYGLETGKPLPMKTADLPANLQAERATFVTLHKNGELRGCIGTIAACLPLAEDVARRAYAAAFDDQRFPPVRADELERLDISISVLTPPEPMAFASEEDLLAQIQPQVDGLILQAGHHKGVFLPSVWESLPDKRKFLRELKRKAGLPGDYWSAAVRVFRFHAEYLAA
jgi:hypothetical protein